ncbi:molecular chaperone [Corynebacterium lactis RW2-5]|uniref:Co-chaperonin GroES n=1 Tax=Corynebacterium lactis RW2-5 TaxID=1408189 RepID=A0A0K2GYA0_9CORY|nr:molecular chaperone [Corynebacterium lactis RW2-5]
MFDTQLFTRDDGCARQTNRHKEHRNTACMEDFIVANVNIKPLEDRVLVKINEAETTTASGLVIPDSAKEKPQEATVIAVGPGRWADDDDRIPMDVKEGDVVIFSKYGGTELKYAGEEYLLLSQRDILAVIEN